MDLVGGCRAFVSVGEASSFTRGAAAARMPQSVASRRIAALERHLGERLFDRSSRRATLTAFGQDMLPSAQRLVLLADAMGQDAQRASLRPLRVAVPEICATRDLAELDAEARAHELFLEFLPASPGQRAEMVRTHDVRAAISAVPPDTAAWTVATRSLNSTSAGPTPDRHAHVSTCCRHCGHRRRSTRQSPDGCAHSWGKTCCGTGWRRISAPT